MDGEQKFMGVSGGFEIMHAAGCLPASKQIITTA